MTLATGVGRLVEHKRDPIALPAAARDAGGCHAVDFLEEAKVFELRLHTNPLQARKLWW
jgi:hypothetical protein